MSIRAALRESSTLGDIVTRAPSERPVVFYAEDSFTYVQFEGYINELLTRSRFPLLYVTSDADDPLFEQERPGLEVRYVDRQLARLMSRLAGSVVVMTMPDLGRFHVPKPELSKVLYVFHSLNSVHTAYREGAFDNYDVFACTGPHHINELSVVRASRETGPADLSEIGYYKLDRISHAHEGWSGTATGSTPEVLLAPSWGRDNLLEAHGEEIIASLLAEGLVVTVRPHPQFFHSLYPEGADVMARLQKTFGRNQNVFFEMSIENEDSFHRSAVMISDWSGAAFEYALGTLRPALFVETPPKIFNPDWENVGLPAFEHEMRILVGEVVPSDEAGAIGSRVSTMVDRAGAYRDDLSALRERVVFNPGRSAESCADLVEQMVERL